MPSRIHPSISDLLISFSTLSGPQLPCSWAPAGSIIMDLPLLRSSVEFVFSHGFLETELCIEWRAETVSY